MIFDQRKFDYYIAKLGRKLGITLCGGGNSTPAVVPPADTIWTIQGQELTVLASKLHGGAVYSLVWNNLAFVDAADLGREIQTAYQINNQGENNNPTEAGSSSTYGSVPSRILTASVSGKQFTSSVNPSFWNPVNGQVYSGDIIGKTITVDWNNIINCVRQDITVTTSQPYQTVFFEGLTGYVNGTLSSVYSLNGNVLTPLVVADPTTDGLGITSQSPLVYATPDGSHAIGIYSPLKEYHAFLNVSGSGVGKWDAAWHSIIPCPAGVYSWTVYYVVGTLTDVQAKLQQLK